MLSNSVLVLNKTEIWENPSLASIQIPLPACSLFSTERLLFSVTVKIKKNKISVAFPRQFLHSHKLSLYCVLKCVLAA